MNKNLIIIIIFLIIISFFSIQESLRKNQIIQKQNTYADSLQNIIDTLEYSMKSIYNIEKHKINSLYQIAKKYNKNINKKTIAYFLLTVKIFQINNIKQEQLLFCQLLYESGFSQFDRNHKLIISKANAIGIAQIKPSTAYYYFRKLSQKKQEFFFKQLKCSDFSFYKNFTKPTPSNYQKQLIKQWLSKKNNNLAMWGFIVYSLSQNYNLNDCFIAYNNGKNALIKLKQNKNINYNEFTYIKNIKKIHTLYFKKKHT